ncbi:Dabb family protein [Novosphingobium sp.]|jgi:hypothetical protein|uniref:Dabb family protein n=1 Tax=Novosphingobium sp. TaxID=1874826 RepID=UPI0031DF947B
MLHHAFFWLKNPASLEDRDTLVRGLKTLGEIPLIRSLQIGIPASTEQRDVVDSGFAVSELMVFDSLADQAAYQSHPIHQRFVETCSHLWSKVVVYDVETLP